MLRHCSHPAAWVALCGLVTVGCGGRDKVSPPDEETPLASAEVGPAGGSLETSDFRLTVPAGAFAAPADLVLFAGREDTALPSASGAFRLEGIPASYTQPLEVSVRLAAPGLALPSEAAYLVAIEENFAHLPSSSVKLHHLIAATVENGFLIGNLPATDEDIPAGVAPGGEDTQSIEISAAAGVNEHTSAEGHIRIRFANAVDGEGAQRLATYLEEAYTRYLALGFSYSARDRWPLEITIANLDAEKFGYYENSAWGHNSGAMEFNRLHLEDQAEMRVTAGHEFFHLVHSFYDSRNRYSRAKSEPPHSWLNEAAGVWAEQFFTDVPDYVSTIRTGRELTPFLGMHAGQSIEGGILHGYGMSALVRWYVDRFGTDALRNAYDRILAGSDPVRALELASGDSVVNWWDEFLRSYVLGEVYHVAPATFAGARDLLWNVASEADSVLNYSTTSADLSAKLLRVRLARTDFTEGARLTLSVDGVLPRATVFRLKGAEIEYLSDGTTSFTTPGLRNLVGDGWDLLLLVSNSRNRSPYTEETAIRLHGKIEEPAELPTFSRIVAIVTVNETREVRLGDGSTKTERVENSIRTAIADGTGTGLTFELPVYQRYELGGGSYGEVTGAISVVLGENGDAITSLRITNAYRIHTPGQDAILVNDYEAVLAGVPLLHRFGNTWVFGANGSGACGQVSSLRIETPAESYRVVGFDCGESSNLDIKFHW